MELIVRRGDREERVAVEREGHRFRVRIGERDYEVDAAVAGGAGGGRAPSAAGGLYSLRVDGGHFEVAVHSERDGAYRVSTSRGAGVIEVRDPLTHLAQASRGAGGDQRKEQVTAMMPGRVVTVLVEEGAAVGEGQGVLVLEAMKMENEILAEHAGVVRRIFVTAGQPVETGEPLFEIG